MAYSDQKMSGSKVTALVIVALVHLALGYAFVTGLATNFVKKQVEKLNTFDVEEPPPPPPDEPPPPPPDIPMSPPPVVSPPPIVRNPNPPPVVINTTPNPPPVYVPTPVVAPPAPPAPAPAPPAPPVVSKAAGAKGNPADWISTDDYPPSSIRAEEEGTSVIAWTINAQGRVENCRTTSSSGSSALDQAACRAITRRGRYSPATDAAGNPIATTATRRVVWKLPQN
ncbi:outer membrane transport energization protein TonB [Sphingomonas palmae]|uniref:Outer membrane transport energization protein TonB n=1 Tax=Sphingomonas palmae TaxID=1855283 RepID=A0A1H7HDM1_9SPHN|nr:energy transducer TonB [Sphingomonas palmae]SEK48379.1 outer membrane transport energization protein TonB [Sphingomonas palmae]